MKQEKRMKELREMVKKDKKGILIKEIDVKNHTVRTEHNGFDLIIKKERCDLIEVFIEVLPNIPVRMIKVYDCEEHERTYKAFDYVYEGAAVSVESMDMKSPFILSHATEDDYDMI